MRAIILSAGKGLRMFPLTANTPKCLIDIGKGKTVLENQLDVLRDCGIKDVVIVAGYCVDQVEAKISGYDTSGMKIKVIYNPFYETTNNIISLWLAQWCMDQECISINGDDIFKDVVIESLLKAEGEIVMTIDRKEQYDDDDMLVITNSNNIKDVGKDLDPKLANGESVGIIKYSEQGAKILKETMEQMVRVQENHQKFYLSVLKEIMYKGYPVVGCEVDEHDWAEIDFHPDVSDVRAKIDFFLTKMS